MLGFYPLSSAPLADDNRVVNLSNLSVFSASTLDLVRSIQRSRQAEVIANSTLVGTRLIVRSRGTTFTSNGVFTAAREITRNRAIGVTSSSQVVAEWVRTVVSLAGVTSNSQLTVNRQSERTRSVEILSSSLLTSVRLIIRNRIVSILPESTLDTSSFITKLTSAVTNILSSSEFVSTPRFYTFSRLTLSPRRVALVNQENRIVVVSPQIIKKPARVPEENRTTTVSKGIR